MLALILLACSGDDAGARADGLLGPFEARHGIAQVGVDDPDRIRLVVGSPVWNGVDLAAVMLGCGVPTGQVVHASLTLSVGEWPHTVDDVEGAAAAEACVTAALGRLPFEEPDAPDAEDVLRLRIVSGVGEQPPISRLRAPDGDLARVTPPPPSYRAAMSPSAIDLDRLVVDGDQVRWPGGDVPIAAGRWTNAAAAAALMRCPADSPSLVRTTLVFAGGQLHSVDTVPENDCVDHAATAAAARIATMESGGRPTADWSRVILVLDIPVGTW